MTFWDIIAPLYDAAEGFNGQARDGMLRAVKKAVPRGSTVLDVACGTGEVGIAAAKKAKSVHCADISARMLSVAVKKAARRGVYNITFSRENMFDLSFEDGAFDVVIASQVLHLVDEPTRAAAELRRVAKNTVVLPMALTADLSGSSRNLVKIFKLFGFAPKKEFDFGGYIAFLSEIGFKSCKLSVISGNIPMVVAVWHKS